MEEEEEEEGGWTLSEAEKNEAITGHVIDNKNGVLIRIFSHLTPEQQRYRKAVAQRKRQKEKRNAIVPRDRHAIMRCMILVYLLLATTFLLCVFCFVQGCFWNCGWDIRERIPLYANNYVQNKGHHLYEVGFGRLSNNSRTICVVDQVHASSVAGVRELFPIHKMAWFYVSVPSDTCFNSPLQIFELWMARLCGMLFGLFSLVSACFFYLATPSFEWHEWKKCLVCHHEEKLNTKLLLNDVLLKNVYPDQNIFFVQRNELYDEENPSFLN